MAALPPPLLSPLSPLESNIVHDRLIRPGIAWFKSLIERACFFFLFLLLLPFPSFGVLLLLDAVHTYLLTWLEHFVFRTPRSATSRMKRKHCPGDRPTHRRGPVHFHSHLPLAGGQSLFCFFVCFYLGRTM